MMGKGSPESVVQTPTSATITKSKILTPDEVIDFLAGQGVVGYSYVDFHYRRWAHLLQVVDELFDLCRRHRSVEEMRILDIGESLHTELLRANYPMTPIDTLDLVDAKYQRRPIDTHYQFDLNDLYFEDRYPEIGHYDLIVMAEVIEHLRTAVPVVLRGIAALMGRGGYLLVQTPNAVALHKRIQMLVGRNPYMSLDRPPEDPPHFREYTIAELVQAGRPADLTPVKTEVHNYFTRGTPVSRFYNAVAERLPKSLRAGITISYAKGPADDP